MNVPISIPYSRCKKKKKKEKLIYGPLTDIFTHLFNKYLKFTTCQVLEAGYTKVNKTDTVFTFN